MNKKVFVGLLIGALLLFLTLRQIDLKSSFEFVKASNWLFLLVGAVLYCSSFAIRSFRWKMLLSKLVNLPTKRCFSFLAIGFFANNTLPFRIGEIVRAYITGKKALVSKSSVLATIVIERVFDGVAYVFLLALSMLMLDALPSGIKNTLITASIIFIGAFVFLITYSKNKELVLKLPAILPFSQKFKDHLFHLINNFAGGLEILHERKILFLTLLLSVIIWLIEASVFFTVAFAFSLQLTYQQCLFVMIAIGFAAILPSAPGYVGTVEFVGVSTLAIFGVEKNIAFGYILTLHAIQLLCVAFMGITSIAREKLTFAELVKIQK